MKARKGPGASLFRWGARRLPAVTLCRVLLPIVLLLVTGGSLVGRPAAVAEGAPSLDAAAQERLAATLAADVAAQPAGTLSVAFRDLHSGARVSLNAAQPWDPASVVKLFVMVQAYHLRAAGALDFNQQVSIGAANTVATASFADHQFPTLIAGATATIGTLVAMMIVQSDNTAYNTLLDLLGRRATTTYLQQSLGLWHTTVGRKVNLDAAAMVADAAQSPGVVNSTTAADVVRLYTLLYRGQLPLAANMLRLLARQKQNYMLPAGLPAGAVMAHKPGEVDDTLRHDGGIVTLPSGGTFVLVVFSSLGSYAILAAIARHVAAFYPATVPGDGANPSAGAHAGRLAGVLRVLLALAALCLLVLVAGLDRGLVGSRPRRPERP